MKSIVNSGTKGGFSVDLEACLVQMEASKAWFVRRVLPLSLDQLRWRPKPHAWSIAECLDHLNTTLAVYLPKIDEAIGRAKRNGGTGGQRRRLDREESMALRRAEPPATIRVSVPATIPPAASVDPDCLVDNFHDTRNRYSECVRRAAALDVASVLIREPIHPVIRSLGGSLALIAVHDRRHIWQAEQVRKAPGFPPSLSESTSRPATGRSLFD